jgi:hypothetical protein
MEYWPGFVMANVTLRPSVFGWMPRDSGRTTALLCQNSAARR